MEDYSLLFHEITCCVNEYACELDISFQKLNYYPANDVFNGIIGKLSLDALIKVSLIFKNNHFLDLEDSMEPEVYKFMLLWMDNMMFENMSIESYIINREKSDILGSSELINKNERNKKRL